MLGELIGNTSFGGGEDDPLVGAGAAALRARGGAVSYFTPDAMVSTYAGGEYRTPVTRRADREPGSALGIGGFQAAVSSRR